MLRFHPKAVSMDFVPDKVALVKLFVRTFRFSFISCCSEITRQAMNAYLNIETRACNNCCSGKALSITHSECLFVALGIQHAKLINHIVICVCPLSSTFPHCPINDTISGEKRSLNIKYVFQASMQLLSEIFSFSEDL